MLAAVCDWRTHQYVLYVFILLYEQYERYPLWSFLKHMLNAHTPPINVENRPGRSRDIRYLH